MHRNPSRIQPTVAALTTLALLAGVMLVPVSPAAGAVTDIDYIGPNSGTVDWSQPGNWNGGNVPDTKGTNGEAGIIDTTITANRTIQLPAGLEAAGFDWNYKSGATGVDTLELSGEALFEGRGATALFNVNNAAGDASKMIVELAGHTFDTVGVGGDGGRGAGAITNYQVTINSASAGGLVRERGVEGSAVIGDNVTVIAAGGNITQNPTNTWRDGSTFQISQSGSSRVDRGPSGGLYDFVIGESDGSNTNAATELRILNGDELKVRNDVTIHPGADMGWFTTGVSLSVAGDYTDDGTVANGSSAGYIGSGSGDLIFDGGGSVQNVRIARTGLTDTGFRVGRIAGTDAHVVLGDDLSTEAELIVTGGSTLDIGTHTTTAGNVQVVPGGELTFAVGSDSGQIVASSTGNGSGDLELDQFTLNLVSSGGWTAGDDLTLFTYDGTLTGTPALGPNSDLSFFTYDSLVAGGGEVKLTNVIPEPTSAALLALGAGVIFMRRRRAAA